MSNKIFLKQVYEGWRNHILPPAAIKDTIEKVSAERLAICRKCPYHSSQHVTIRPDEHCTHCGCPLISKTKCLSCECPINRWDALLAEAEDNALKEAANATESV